MKSIGQAIPIDPPPLGEVAARSADGGGIAAQSLRMESATASASLRTSRADILTTSTPRVARAMSRLQSNSG